MKKIICILLMFMLVLSSCAAENDSITNAEENDSITDSTTEENNEPIAFEQTIDWDAEYDVVVIGFGGAGAVSGITAAEEGAKVLILEKAPLGEEGGNTRYAYQLVMSPDDREAAITYYDQLRGDFDNQTDEIIESMVDGMMGNKDWLIEHGADPNEMIGFPYMEYPELEGVESAVTLIVSGKGATSDYWKLARDNVYDNLDNIDIWYESPAVQLIQDKDSRIVHGVKVENGGKTYNVRAKNGVVMACGGFENSDEMLENYAQLADAYSKGAKYNTGDGVKMAIDVGADLWHMSALSGPDVNFINPDTGRSAGYALTNPDPSAWFTGFPRYNMIIVGGDGTRFMDEATYPRHGHVDVSGTYFSIQVPTNSWCIFDETARLTTPAYPTWSDGMVDEIEKGWVLKADSIEELAELCNIDPVGLSTEIELYNSYCDTGVDIEFGVNPEYLQPVETGPYYAFPLKATLTNTQGGAKRNTDCEVLDVWGNPIPHLYSAGEFGSFFTDIYNGGGNLGETLFTGRRAGAGAAQIKNDVLSENLMSGKTAVDLTVEEVAYDIGENEYIGKGSGIGGELVLKLTMDGEKISKIEVLSQNETVGIGDIALESVIQKILAEQSTEVDAVSGATITSNAIKDAVNDALSKVK